MVANKSKSQEIVPPKKFMFRDNLAIAPILPTVRRAPSDLVDGPMHSSGIGCAHCVRKSSCCVLVYKVSRSIVNIVFGQFPIFSGYYLKITDRVPSFLNDEGGITRQQREINHEISAGTATTRGGCPAILMLRR